MRIADIVEGINKYFIEKYPNKGFFIHKLNIESNPISKAHKTYNFELWHINGKLKNKIIEIQESGRYIESNNNDSIANSILATKLVTEILKNIDVINNYGV